MDERRRLARDQRDLLQAARNGDSLEISILLSEGAETEWTEENEGKTALTLAAQHGRLRAAELFLETGADIDAKCDATGTSAWRKAARSSCWPHQVAIWTTARMGMRATTMPGLQMSVRFHNIDPRGMHVNTYDRGSWTALTECAHYGAHVDGKPGNADPAIPRVACAGTKN